MMSNILMNVPVWVWSVFALLVVAGLAFRRGTVSRPPVTLVISLGFIGWSLAGVISAFGANALPLACWAVGVALGLAIGTRLVTTQGGLRLAGAGRVQVPGSWMPLVVMMGIFGLKFAHGVVSNVQPSAAAFAAYAPGMSALLGALSGTFLARAIVVVRFARAG